MINPLVDSLILIMLVIVAFTMIVKGFGKSGFSQPPFRRGTLLNKSELRLYRLLTNELPNDYSVMLQVSYGAFLRNPSFKRYMTINSKRADFIILDVDLNVLAVIEYQGSGHFGNTAKSRDRAIKSDKVKRKALFEAGITLIEVPPKFDQNYIRTNLTDLMTQKTAVV